MNLCFSVSRLIRCLRPGDCYFMFRAFIPGEAETAKLHCIHMEEIENGDETKTFRAIFFQKDPLEWFDT